MYVLRCRRRSAVALVFLPKNLAFFGPAGDKRSMRAKKLPVQERRSGGDRRKSPDRREMPRPEGRRRNGGRRAGDPSDA
jgi:hypothetical protein